jgi:spermidine synthase
VSDVEFVPDERGGVTVVVDGHPQSYVHLADPGLLVFEYVAQIGAVLDSLPAGRLAVTHVGGGGLTLPRYVEHTRPGSPQIVLEPDAGLTEAVRRELPLPRGHRIRVRPIDGRTGMGDLRDATADAVVLDAYAAGRVPRDLVTTAFLSDARRVLRPQGVLLANIADEPDLRFLGRVVASAREAVGPVAVVATRDVLKGRRFGNAVVVASPRGPDVEALRRSAATAAFATGVWAGHELDRRFAGAPPLRPEDGIRPPLAPDPGRWRVR